MFGHIYHPSSKSELQNVVLNHHLIVIDFYADWCGPCKKLSPILEKIAEDYPNVQIVKVNVDDLDIDKITLSSVEFSISALPTILFFKNSIFKEKVMGYNPDAILKLVQQLA